MFSDRLETLLPELRAYAQLLCGNAVLADDIVQTACLSAWQNRDQFDPEKGPLRAWLFRIVRNAFYQQKRSDRLRHTEDADAFEHALVADCGLESRSSLARMLQAVQSLKVVQRDAFLLVVAAGFTYEEAGQVLGCAPGTIKSRVSRAREVALERFHSEDWSTDAREILYSPINHLHDALNRIQTVSAAA